MTFEVGKTFNAGAGWVCSSPIVYNTLSNPVITALLITALTMIIVYAMNAEALKETPWRRRIKTGLWVLLAVSGGVFVHYYAMRRHAQETSGNKGLQSVMESIHQSSAIGTARFPVELGQAYTGSYETLEDGGGEAQAPPPAARREDNVGGGEPGIGELEAELGLRDVTLESTV